MRKYNAYRTPFFAGAMTICVLTAVNTSRSLAFRFLPVIVFAPFITLYNHHIGMYGVHREIDSVLELMAGDND